MRSRSKSTALGLTVAGLIAVAGPTSSLASGGPAASAASAAPPASAAGPAGPAGAATEQSSSAAWSFHSQGFHPAAVTVSSDPDHTSGDIFLTPRNGYQRRVRFDRGPMIINRNGQLVWFRNLGSKLANNLEVQRYQGKPVLTWWQGTESGGDAEDVIADSSYRTVAIIRAVGPGLQADTHEFQITPQGTALIDTVAPVKTNLSSMGGPKDGTVDNCIIQEIDIKTGKLLWSWDALGHIPVTASYTRPVGSTPWDYFHLNSIQQLPDGNLLISARNTWGVYEINKKTKGLMWTLGGKRSNFFVGSLAKFEWQHDARLSGSTLSLFDDASDGPEQQESESSGKVLTLNFNTRTAVLAHRYAHSPPVVSVSQGNTQRLPNHNVFVGWGSAPDFSEYTSSGRQIFSGSFALGVESYRAYRFLWGGQPLTRPSMANTPGPNGTVTVYASWNGATELSAWRVLGGQTPQSMVVLDPRTTKRGFETAIKLHSEPRYFEVQALDSQGQVLSTSTPHTDRAHVAIFSPAAFMSSVGGQTGVPVACLMDSGCTVRVSITSGHSTLAQAKGTQISSEEGKLVGLGLTAPGRTEVDHAPDHRLQVEVTASSSGVTASTHMFLIPYSVSGPGPGRSLSGSPTVQIVSPNVFVDSAGHAAILAACYGGAPCHPQATLTVNGAPVGTSTAQHLGTDELGDVYVPLTAAGKLMLEHASGNQLGAQLKLVNGADTASGQVALIRYD
jgi:hypothetical protein